MSRKKFARALYAATAAISMLIPSAAALASPDRATLAADSSFEALGSSLEAATVQAEAPVAALADTQPLRTDPESGSAFVSDASPDASPETGVQATRDWGLYVRWGHVSLAEPDQLSNVQGDFVCTSDEEITNVVVRIDGIAVPTDISYEREANKDGTFSCSFDGTADLNGLDRGKYSIRFEITVNELDTFSSPKYVILVVGDKDDSFDVELSQPVRKGNILTLDTAGGLVSWKQKVYLNGEAVGAGWGGSKVILSPGVRVCVTPTTSRHVNIVNSPDMTDLCVEYVPETGSLEPQWINDGDHWYYWIPENTVSVGWQRINGRWYFFSPDFYTDARGNDVDRGMMLTGWVNTSGKWYYLNPSGAMATGWKQIDGTWYYLNPGGDMATGWKLNSGKWYFLSPSGVMATGWKQVGGTWYFFAPGGNMHTGWLQQGSAWYYLKSSGAMATGTQVIGGRTYVFNAGGVWIR
ncbi:MAG: hypothetical protein QM705_05070 [Ancrocorticia sp.]